MKRILLAVALLTCFVCFTSCEKNEAEQKTEEDTIQEDILGLWSYESEAAISIGGIMMKNELYFNKSGYGYFATSITVPGNIGATKEQEFNYSVKGKVITYNLKEDTGSTICDKVRRVTDNTLKVERTTKQKDGTVIDTSTLVYTREK